MAAGNRALPDREGKLATQKFATQKSGVILAPTSNGQKKHGGKTVTEGTVDEGIRRSAAQARLPRDRESSFAAAAGAYARNFLNLSPTLRYAMDVSDDGSGTQTVR